MPRFIVFSAYYPKKSVSIGAFYVVHPGKLLEGYGVHVSWGVGVKKAWRNATQMADWYEEVGDID